MMTLDQARRADLKEWNYLGDNVNIELFVNAAFIDEVIVPEERDF